MNLESFAIGIVTMVVFALAVATVIGMLKVVSITREVVKLKRRLEDDERELSRDINMVDRTLQNQLDQRIDNVYQSLETVSRQDKAYTDKRIDKLIDTYFEHVGSKKQILKD
jgi:predicted Holliday junction resolvase-like endonuclease